MNLTCDSPSLNRHGIEAPEPDGSGSKHADVSVTSNPVHAFRGLAYAVAFQAGAAALGFALWEILRRLL